MTTPPEAGPGGGPAKFDLMKKLKEFFTRLMGKKVLEEGARKAAEEYKKEQEEYESKAKRDEELDRQKLKDQERQYHKVRSAEVAELSAEMSRTTKAVQVNEKLDRVLSDSEQFTPEGAAYLIDTILVDADVHEALRNLIDQSSAAREAINTLITQGRGVHGNARRLLLLSQNLVFEAQKTGDYEKLESLLNQLSQRATNLLHDEFRNANSAAKRSYRSGYRSLADYLREERGIVLSGEEKTLEVNLFKEDGEMNQAAFVDSLRSAGRLITEPRQVREEGLEERKAWIEGSSSPPEGSVPGAIVSDIEALWSKMSRMEDAGEMEVRDLVDFSQQIRQIESNYIPQDLPPGSEAYSRSVQQMRNYTEEKYKLLASKLKERLQKERPVIRTGINDPEEFIKEAALSKGRIGGLFDQNPAMYELLLGLGEESRRFRDRIFLAIHGAVLTDQRNDSNRNFGLYEMADFTTFLDVLRTELGKYKVEETNRTLGETLVDHYNNLSNTIRQCRDIDHWAAQPAATIENFNRSLGLFQNEYVKTAFNIPAVNAAFRAYETVLRSIMTSNDGFIPNGLIDYNDTYGASYWDNQSKMLLEQMIKQGVVPGISRDKRLGLTIIDSDGHSIVMDFDNPLKREDISDEEIRMYMTLAKGMGMATARYLEMFAQARVPGSNNPEHGMDRFHSMPYEGIATSLNYFNMFISKWKIGSYKFWYLFNQLVPEKDRVTVNENDRLPGIKAFMAYQDGTFEEKYGPDAKRFMDLFNFSNISSALGKTTTWRQYDTTYKWSDVAREKLGAVTQIVLAERYTGEKVKEILVDTKYKALYRQELIKRNAEEPNLQLPTSGAKFDALWQEYGREKYSSQINMEWDKRQGKDPRTGEEHTKLSHETNHMKEVYTKAFKTRKWVEMAMRNPLALAHTLKVDMKLSGYGDDKDIRKTSLHRLIAHEILGISPEATKYAERFGKSADYTDPDQEQLKFMNSILQLERDLTAVKERAINEGRDLREDDFYKTIAKKGSMGEISEDLRPRVENALKYWKTVRKLIIGSDNPDSANQLYREIGLDVINEQDYAWDYEKIEEINKTVGEISKKAGIKFHNSAGQEFIVGNLLETALDNKMEWIYATDDMAFNKMDLLTLGSRQLIRRGGDIGSHDAGGKATTDYLIHGITPNPNKEKLAEYLLKIRDGYSGDEIEKGWAVTATLAYMTDRLYAWDWTRAGSSAQRDVWRTLRNVAGWTANGRREFWDALEHMDVLPPHDHFYHYAPGGIPEKSDIHTMRKLVHATNPDVWTEIILLGFVLATAITLWRAFTAKSEEEESGGGGN